MNKKKLLFSLLIVVLLTRCSHNNNKNNVICGLPIIDLNINYPEKVIDLSDISDITYIHLDSKRDEFLYKGSIKYITENSIVVYDRNSGSVLFFSKNGTPKSRFNRRGQGPEEYFGWIQIVYDEAKDDVFISINNSIKVYSSIGEYKRNLHLPSGTRLFLMGNFDNQSLIVFDESRMLYKVQPKTAKDNMDYLNYRNDSSFFLISKADGQVDYIQMSASQNDISLKTPSGQKIPSILYTTYIVKHTEGFLLCNPATDTAAIQREIFKFLYFGDL